MRTPAAAIAWEFRRRNRWGLIAVTVSLFIITAIKLLTVGLGKRINFDDSMSFALVVIVPLSATFMYFLAVFTFGLTGDVAARQSIYPVRMFTLPVTTAALAGWPMLYGTLAMAALWFATRLLAVWPSDVDVPLFWPALLAASLLAWTQALTWMPYALPGLRVIVTVLWLMVIDAIVMIALQAKASELTMLAILAPHVPLAYLAARFAVARARRGDVPDWRVIRRTRAAHAASPFPSASRAQLWFEWRQYGWSLPAMVGIVVPCELTLLFIFSETPVIVFETLATTLVTPPFMAAFVAAMVGRSTPFLATRPSTTVSLIAAKLKVAALSACIAWLLVIAAIPIAVRLSGTWPLVSDWMREGVDIFGMPRFVAIVLLGFAALLASTWKQLVQSLYIAIGGREWLVKASVFLPLSLLAVAFPLSYWILRSKVAMAALWSSFPWILGMLVFFKLGAAAWIAVRLRDRRLFSDRTLILGAVAWNVAVFALFGLLRWLLPEMIFQSYFLALVAILLIPLARLSAAPLALAWNRHR
jgi:hypothetical protein